MNAPLCAHHCQRQESGDPSQCVIRGWEQHGGCHCTAGLVDLDKQLTAVPSLTQTHPCGLLHTKHRELLHSEGAVALKTLKDLFDTEQNL